MTTVLVQEALRSGAETLTSLEQKYALKTKRHGKYPNLVLIKYDQIASPMADPLVQQCRGIILDEDDGWRIVSRPFDKFFNAGEPLAAEIDWPSARVQEKLDGSLIQLYHYKGEWHFATSGTPDASGPVGDSGKTFSQLIWEVWVELGYEDPRHPDLTFLFELMTPLNRVVVPHDRNRLVLIGVRDRVTGQEFHVHDWAGPEGYEKVREFHHKSLQELSDAFAGMSGLDQEGFIVKDAHFRRVKVKHPNYVLYHQMVGSLTKKKVLDAVRRGEAPEVLAYFPTWQSEFDAMKEKLDKLVSQYEQAYEGVRAIPVQKDFALAVQKLGLSTAPLFSIRAGKSKSFRDHFAEMRLEAIADLLGLKGDDTPLEQ